MSRKKLLSIIVAGVAYGSLFTPLVTPISAGFIMQPAQARKKFDKATAEPSEANLKQGLDLIKQSNYEAAIDSFQQAIYFSRNHYNPEAYKLLGICYKATRQYSKAIEALRMQLSQTTVPEPDVRIDLAECLLEIGEIDKARDEISRAYSDSQGRSTHRQRFAMGEMHEKMKDYGQANGCYEAALEEKKTYTDAAMGIARTDVLLKRYNEALKMYRTILDKGPLFPKVNYEELYYNMGNCFLNRGDHQGALDHWRMALETNPESFDCHLALGRMLDEEKHYSSATKEYEAALRCLPKNGGLGMRDQIMRRLQYIEAQLAPREAAPVVKPSPQMRQEYEDSIKQRQEVMTTTPPTKDSGF
jgi:tetratricopeptide (TPR) repeat protein